MQAWLDLLYQIDYCTFEKRRLSGAASLHGGYLFKRIARCLDHAVRTGANEGCLALVPLGFRTRLLHVRLFGLGPVVLGDVVHDKPVGAAQQAVQPEEVERLQPD